MNEKPNPGLRAGAVLVVLQFVSLTVIALHALPALRAWPTALVIAGSIALSLWALAGMGRGTFRFHPQPSGPGRLCTGGAYRVVRHPMYTAVLAASLAVVWGNPSIADSLALCVVVGVLYFKIRIEESALRRKFPSYTAYARSVPAVVPFLPRKP